MAEVQEEGGDMVEGGTHFIILRVPLPKHRRRRGPKQASASQRYKNGTEEEDVIIGSEPSKDAGAVDLQGLTEEEKLAKLMSAGNSEWGGTKKPEKKQWGGYNKDRNKGKNFNLNWYEENGEDKGDGKEEPKYLQVQRPPPSPNPTPLRPQNAA